MSTTTPNYGWTLPGVNDPVDANLWGTQLNNNLSSQDTTIKAISNVANGGVPIMGEIRFKAGTTVPSGWLLCYGQAIDRTVYSALFAEIGIAWGGGGSTFNVPDLRGRAPFGVDNMGGVAANRVTFAISGITGSTLGATGGSENMYQHTHAITDAGHFHVAGLVIQSAQAASTRFGVSNTGSNSTIFDSGSSVSADGNGAKTSTVTTGITIDNAGSGSSQNMPPAAMGYYIIYSGV